MRRRRKKERAKRKKATKSKRESHVHAISRSFPILLFPALFMWEYNQSYGSAFSMRSISFRFQARPEIPPIGIFAQIPNCYATFLSIRLSCFFFSCSFSCSFSFFFLPSRALTAASFSRLRHLRAAAAAAAYFITSLAFKHTQEPPQKCQTTRTRMSPARC